jgi:hypothetical protein
MLSSTDTHGRAYEQGLRARSSQTGRGLFTHACRKDTTNEGTGCASDLIDAVPRSTRPGAGPPALGDDAAGKIGISRGRVCVLRAVRRRATAKGLLLAGVVRDRVATCQRGARLQLGARGLLQALVKVALADALLGLRHAGEASIGVDSRRGSRLAPRLGSRAVVGAPALLPTTTVPARVAAVVKALVTLGGCEVRPEGVQRRAWSTPSKQTLGVPTQDVIQAVARKDTGSDVAARLERGAVVIGRLAGCRCRFEMLGKAGGTWPLFVRECAQPSILLSAGAAAASGATIDHRPPNAATVSPVASPRFAARIP